MFAFNNDSFQPELRLCDTATGGSTFIPPAIGSTAPGGLRQLGGAGIEGVGEPAITLAGVEFTDQCIDPESNMNGIIEPGEAVYFDVELAAVVGDFSGISGVLSSTNADVIPFANSANWPDLLAGESAIGDPQFDRRAHPRHPLPERHRFRA